jgi:hypothetical protein
VCVRVGGQVTEGVSAHQVRMKGVNKGNVSRVGTEALGKLEHKYQSVAG